MEDAVRLASSATNGITVGVLADEAKAFFGEGIVIT